MHRPCMCVRKRACSCCGGCRSIDRRTGSCRGGEVRADAARALEAPGRSASPAPGAREALGLGLAVGLGVPVLRQLPDEVRALELGDGLRAALERAVPRARRLLLAGPAGKPLVARGLGGARPLGGVGREEPAHQALGRAGHAPPAGPAEESVAREHGVAVQRAEDAHVRGLEGRLAGEELEEHHPGAPEVALVGVEAVEDLRRCVEERARDRVPRGLAGAGLRKAEVQQLERLAARVLEAEVLGLDVPVHDAQVVHGDQRVQYLQCKAADHVDWKLILVVGNVVDEVRTTTPAHDRV
mmetsp:Transcript_97777/g.304020  ORF Transcript_97777/g.304020 Transcript_97777/m.304020 type:complete len:298 (+) Transcript_97777:126-1019(+)